MKWVRKLLAGGEKKYDMPPSRKGVFRIVRREMLIGLPLLYGIAYLIAAVIVPFFADTVVTESVSWATGTEVALSDASFNLLTGNLTLVDFSLQDPQAPDENLIAIPEVRVNAGLLPLASNRLVFDSIAISDAELHVKRETDGTLNIDNASAGWDASGYLDWAKQYAGRIDWMGLMRRLSSYLANWNPLVPRENPYEAYGGRRLFPEEQSPLIVRQLEIGRLLVTLQDEMVSYPRTSLPPIRMFEVEMTNLAFPASLRTKPLVVSLHGQWGDDEESGFRVSATLSPVGEGGVTTIEFAITRLDLSGLTRFYATTFPIRVLSGLMSLSGRIQLDGETASGSMSFLLEDFQLANASTYPLFGLPPATSERVIEGINRYAQEVPMVFAVGIEGTNEAPVVAWEAPLLEIAREGLMMAGRRELNRTILELGNRIDGLGGAASIPMDSDFQALQQAAESVARDAIEQAGGGLLQELPAPGSGDRQSSHDGSDAPLLDQLPGLLQRLLDSTSKDSDTEDSGSDTP